MRRFTISLLLIGGCFFYHAQAQKVDSLKVNQDSVYKNPEVMAMHPKGKDYLRTFIEQNFNPAVPVQNNAPDGTYTVQIWLFIDTAGKLNPVPKTNVGYGMEKEVLRILKKLPDFIPAKQSGIPVKSLQTLPVLFMVKRGN